MPVKLFLFACTVSILFSSCKQEHTDLTQSPQPASDSTHTDSIATNPYVIRNVHVKGKHSLGPIDVRYSIQYDTNASAINIFYDDSTTITPYDALAAVYHFNADGYLLEGRISDAYGNLKPQFSIIRNSTNHIEKVVEYGTKWYNDMWVNDTITYHYASGIAEDSIMVSSNDGLLKYTFLFDKENKVKSKIYNKNNSLISVDTYNYTAQNTISHIEGTYDTTDYKYSAMSDNEWTKLPELFLGKDAYILIQRPLSSWSGYSFLSFPLESKFQTMYNPMLTAPLTTLERHGYIYLNTEYLNSTVQFTTSYMPDHRIKSITTLANDGVNYTYTFDY